MGGRRRYDNMGTNKIKKCLTHIDDCSGALRILGDPSVDMWICCGLE